MFIISIHLIKSELKSRNRRDAGNATSNDKISSKFKTECRNKVHYKIIFPKNIINNTGMSKNLRIVLWYSTHRVLYKTNLKKSETKFFLTLLFTSFTLQPYSNTFHRPNEAQLGSSAPLKSATILKYLTHGCKKIRWFFFVSNSKPLNSLMTFYELFNRKRV